MADWYSYDKISSYNATFNFILARRGNGKSYGAKDKVLRNYARRGEQFILLRRFKTELEQKNTFLDDLNLESYPELDFRVFGSKVEAAPRSTREDKKRPWQTAGHFIALTEAQKIKSTPFPKVTTIIFEEFILENVHTQYLRDEVKILLGLYDTVDRREGRVKMFFLANTVSIMNPYFIFWDIDPNVLPEYSKHKNGRICIHLVPPDKFVGRGDESDFAQLIAGTEYGNFADKAQFKDAHLGLIEGKTSDAKYMYTLETRQGMFAVWFDGNIGKYFCQQKRNKGNEKFVTLVAENMSDEKRLVDWSSPVMSALRTAFRHGRVSFDKPATRNIFVEVFKR